jgi:hypothetical protein
MALFFCGIVLAHYNSYNLSEVSKVKVAIEYGGGWWWCLRTMTIMNEDGDWWWR